MSYSRKVRFSSGERYRWEWGKVLKRSCFGAGPSGWGAMAFATGIDRERLRRIHRHHGDAPVGSTRGNATADEATAICRALDVPAYCLKTTDVEPPILPSGLFYILARRVMANEEEGEELLEALQESYPTLLLKYLPEFSDFEEYAKGAAA
ncbi:hypothetical protein [Streptomyces sp. NPDC057002]|uniref:hypothetical protein n=1 Tax=Streptomyces sp. NPDC057002 TaxID=3345992 RepID=UPI003633AF15